MAFTYGFYNYDANDAGDAKLYDAQQMSQIFDGIITDGVYAHVGDKFMVTAMLNGKVKVGSGRAWFNHTWNYNDNDLILDPLEKPTVNNRIDAVIIEVNSDRNSRTNTIKWKAGYDDTSSPERPKMAHSTNLNQYALAYVLRTPDDRNVILEDRITNAVGTDETPYVTGVLETISASQILSDFTAEFDSFLTSLQARCDEEIKKYSQQAAASAGTATTKANEASTSATSAFNSANTAAAKASEASNSASTATSKASAASTSATSATNSSKLAESYAKGGTGTRTGENTDNALYYKDLAKTYAENAEAVTGIEIATTSRAGIVKPDGETIFVNEGGKITAGISDTDWAALERLFQ